MAKFTSKPITVEAYVVTESEGKLQATTARGIEQLVPDDAVVTVDGKSFAVLGPLFAVLFESDGPKGKGKGSEAEDEPHPRGRGGQQASGTKA
jgi:hypothetical protein